MAVLKESKPIIFDLSAFEQQLITTKIEEQLSLGIKPQIESAMMNKGFESPVHWLFLFWLADHSDGVQIWLGDQYERYAMALLPTVKEHLIPKIKEMDARLLLSFERVVKRINQSTRPCHGDCIARSKQPDILLELPPEQVKKYFNQPRAVVVQSGELLALLDEFLAVIAQ